MPTPIASSSPSGSVPATIPTRRPFSPSMQRQRVPSLLADPAATLIPSRAHEDVRALCTFASKAREHGVHSQLRQSARRVAHEEHGLVRWLQVVDGGFDVGVVRSVRLFVIGGGGSVDIWVVCFAYDSTCIHPHPRACYWSRLYHDTLNQHFSVIDVTLRIRERAENRRTYLTVNTPRSRRLSRRRYPVPRCRKASCLAERVWLCWLGVG